MGPARRQPGVFGEEGGGRSLPPPALSASSLPGSPHGTGHRADLLYGYTSSMMALAQATQSSYATLGFISHPQDIMNSSSSLLTPLA